MNKKSNGRQMESSRRGEILTVAAALFREKGYDATTIRDITTAVGIASGSTFCHFKSKRDILDAVAIDGMCQVLRGAEALSRRQLSPEEHLRLLLRQHMRLLHDPPSRDFVTVLLYESRSLSAAGRSEVMDLMARYEAIWKDCLRRLAALPPASAKESLLHRLLFGALNWTVHWYSPDDKLPPEALAEEIAGLLLPGMRAGASGTAS